MAFGVIYDACVLFPTTLRDILVDLATTDLFHARWTRDIHREWMVAAQREFPERTKEQWENIRALMDENVRDCLVTGYEDLIPSLTLPDPNDRHVLAAAIRTHAQVIVTTNLRDFPAEALAQYNIEAQHPDTFIEYALDLDFDLALQSLKRVRCRWRRPPFTPLQFIEHLRSRCLNRVADILTDHIDLL